MVDVIGVVVPARAHPQNRQTCSGAWPKRQCIESKSGNEVQSKSNSCRTKHKQYGLTSTRTRSANDSCRDQARNTGCTILAASRKPPGCKDEGP